MGLEALLKKTNPEFRGKGNSLILKCRAVIIVYIRKWQIVEYWQVKKLLLGLLLFLPGSFYLHAQDMTNNTDLVITTGSLIHVAGNFTNNGSVENDGTLEVEGNFNNIKGQPFTVYTDNTSMDRVVKFVGSGKQIIMGDMGEAGSASFYNLLVDQEDASDTVEMETNVVVEGSVIFGSENISPTYSPESYYDDNMQLGLLKTFQNSAHEYLLDVQNPDPGAISGYPFLEIGGAPSTGFILTSGVRGSTDGGLQLAISTEEEYYWPIGTIDKGYNAFGINFYSVPGSGSVKGKFCDNSTAVSGYVGKVSQYCYGCDDPAYPSPDNNGYNRYWSQDICNVDADENPLPQWVVLEDAIKNHGYWSFDASNTGYQYYVEAYPNNFTMEGSTTDTWRTIKHDDTYGADPSVSTVDWRPEIESTISGTDDILYYTQNTLCYGGSAIPGGVYTDFGTHFTMKKAKTDNALPVELLYVQANAVENKYINVSWATAIESNNAGFEVMRGTDGINFKDIGWVKGHNNSTVQSTYSYNDNTVNANTQYYYKLRQTDNNGHSVYSTIVEANLASLVAFNVYPNPTDNAFTLNIVNPSESVDVTIYDITGRKIFSQVYAVEPELTSKNITLQAAGIMSSGVYQLCANTGGTAYRQKVVLR